MRLFKECEEVGGHDLQFEPDGENDIQKVSGYLFCTQCGATSDGISVNLSIKGESISEILYKEQEDDLRANDDNRISQGLKQ